MSLTTIGYLDFCTGKIYSRKADRTRIQNQRKAEQIKAEEAELNNAIHRLKSKFTVGSSQKR